MCDDPGVAQLRGNRCAGGVDSVGQPPQARQAASTLITICPGALAAFRRDAAVRHSRHAYPAAREPDVEVDQVLGHQAVG